MTGRRLSFLLLLPYAIWLVVAYRYHFLDHANLLFHEAGHVFFGPFGETMGMLGGTFGQFVFPGLALGSFIWQGKNYQAAVALLWVGENFLYTSVYMGDAEVQNLPLVGGGIHDWHWLFSRWDCLEATETIAGTTYWIGSLIILGAAAWAFSVAYEVFMPRKRVMFRVGEGSAQ